MFQLLLAEHLEGQHTAEVTDLRLMLSSQETTIECQKDEIQKLKELLSERTFQLNVREESFQRSAEELKNLKLGNGLSGSTRLHNKVMIMLTGHFVSSS